MKRKVSVALGALLWIGAALTDAGVGGRANAQAPSSDAPSLTGATGLYRVSSAAIRPDGGLQLALRAEFARANDLLALGDDDTRTGGTLSGSVAVNRHLELFGSLQALANREHETIPGGTAIATSAIDGRLLLGGKLAAQPRPALAYGGEIGIDLPLDGSRRVDAISIWVGALGSLDLSAVSGFPLRMHANVGIFDDNSESGFAFTGLSESERQIVMFEHGLGVRRVRLALGFDAPLDCRLGLPGLSPFLEYHADIATGDGDPAFEEQTPFNRDQQWLTLGLRSRIAGRLTLDAGIDLLVRPVAPIYGPSLPPYNFIAGISLPIHR